MDDARLDVIRKRHIGTTPGGDNPGSVPRTRGILAKAIAYRMAAVYLESTISAADLVASACKMGYVRDEDRDSDSIRNQLGQALQEIIESLSNRGSVMLERHYQSEKRRLAKRGW